VLFSLLLFGASALGDALTGGGPEWIDRSVTTQIAWLLWNVISLVGAGYVVASIAPRAREAHGLAMGTIQALFTLWAMMTVADTATPSWLWTAGILATIPAAWAGARLGAARAGERERLVRAQHGCGVEA
jgi:hypothetical protein